MTDTIWACIIAVGGTLLGVLITQYYDLKKWESEERRWYADYFLGRKIDALNNLYAALVDCHFAMNFYGNCPPATLQEFKEKVQSKEEAYLRAKVMASIYLDDEGDRIMSSALGAFRQANRAIWLKLPDVKCLVDKDLDDLSDIKFDWNNFAETYEKAVTYLKERLNPNILVQIVASNKSGTAILKL